MRVIWTQRWWYLFMLWGSFICSFQRNGLFRLRSSKFMSTSSKSAMDKFPHQEVIESYSEKLRDLQGKPEIVDLLRNISSTYSGIQRNLNFYKELYPFKLDSFQLNGLQAILDNKNVLVSTPTGSGKTVVGELAIYFALMMGYRVAYTTPLKALSNQKLFDFQERYGKDRVGLLTGDIVQNRNAPIMVMTTEIFRNMLYDSQTDLNKLEKLNLESTNSKYVPNNTTVANLYRDQVESAKHFLSNLFVVCFDEFHYMNDADRGSTWEECVIGCPANMRILALSATMGNVKEIQSWMSSIHGKTTLIQSDFRPVPLRYFYAIKPKIIPFFADAFAGPGSLASQKKNAGSNTSRVENEVNETTKNETNSIVDGTALNPSIARIEKEQSSKAANEKIASFDAKSIENILRRRQKLGDDDQFYTGDDEGLEEEILHSLKKSSAFQPENLAIGRNTILLPEYPDVIAHLVNEEKLPAIFFLFSRGSCEEYAEKMMKIFPSPTANSTFKHGASSTRYRNSLITREDLTDINNAILLFLQTHPLIPIKKSHILMLQAGIGIHHAGLLNQWKSFIEMLFNQNKLKILFATETLAAGVNMPARTTIITTVTKQVQSKVVALKTSQLLQMAGRAGRRGKDSEGNVIILKNQYDELKLVHQLLLSQVDSIKSQFRFSYKFVLKLLLHKTLLDCRLLLERTFSAYVNQLRKQKTTILNKQDKQTVDNITGNSLEDEKDLHFQILLQYPMATVKEYIKLYAKLIKEYRTFRYLEAKMIANQMEFHRTLIDHISCGIGVTLITGDYGMFLGRVHFHPGTGITLAHPAGVEESMQKLKTKKTSKKVTKFPTKSWIEAYVIQTNEHEYAIVSLDQIYSFSVRNESLTQDELGNANQLRSYFFDIMSNVTLPNSSQYLGNRWERSEVPHAESAVHPITIPLNISHTGKQLQQPQKTTKIWKYHHGSLAEYAMMQSPSTTYTAPLKPFAFTPELQKQQGVLQHLEKDFLNHEITRTHTVNDTLKALQYIMKTESKQSFPGAFKQRKMQRQQKQVPTPEGSNMTTIEQDHKDTISEEKESTVNSDEEEEVGGEDEEEEEEMKTTDSATTTTSTSTVDNIYVWKKFQQMIEMLLHIDGVKYVPVTTASHPDATYDSPSDSPSNFPSDSEKSSNSNNAIATKRSSSITSSGNTKPRRIRFPFENLLSLEDGDWQPFQLTSFGHLVISMTGRTDNEVWLAYLLSHPTFVAAFENGTLTHIHFAAIISALCMDPHRASRATIHLPTSPVLLTTVKQTIKPLQIQLTAIQAQYGIDSLPIHFATPILGLTEAWCKGISWYNLCLKTSFDQGDLSRLFLHTIEILQDIAFANLLSPVLSSLAYEAILVMDRFPINYFDAESDESSSTNSSSTSSSSSTALSSNEAMTQNTLTMNSTPEDHALDTVRSSVSKAAEKEKEGSVVVDESNMWDPIQKMLEAIDHESAAKKNEAVTKNENEITAMHTATTAAVATTGKVQRWKQHFVTLETIHELIK